MTTPITVAIPPLKENQTIAAWQPLFVAAVSAIDQKAVVKRLPAYVKRGRLEERVVLGAVEKETIEEAFDYLKERLDPDIFEAAAEFRRMTWGPGELVQDFFTRYLEEAIKARLAAKSACVFMISQAPIDVQHKLKEWVKPKGNDMTEAEALQFGPQLRKALTEKGFPLDHGCRVHYVARATVSRSQASWGNEKANLAKARVQQYNESARIVEKGSLERGSAIPADPPSTSFAIAPTSNAPIAERLVITITIVCEEEVEREVNGGEQEPQPSRGCSRSLAERKQ